MTNSLIIVNEPLSEMFLGKNTTLSYITACAELEHEIYIFDLSQSSEINDKNLKVFHLKKSDALLLAKKFREENLRIKNLRKINRYDELAKLQTKKIDEVLDKNFSADCEIATTKIDFILQRLEPMKSPFPPEGNAAVKDVMKSLKNLFPNHIFNCPITDNFIELEDKETPQEINKILRREIATPTAEFSLGSSDLLSAIELSTQKYREIFQQKNNEKIVIKPKNSAQSLGVFALQFSEKGFDLETLKSKKVSELSNIQIYKIHKQNLEKILTILCFVQRVKDDKNYSEKFVGDIAENEMFAKAVELYNHTILAQPFLEGITQGDIRANILKDEAGNFYCVGYVFRSSNREAIDDEFTTCYTTGGAVSKPISFLSNSEKMSLTSQCEMVLKILNNELRQKYKNTIELGADFILVGDQKSVMLGEINHHCPALIPIAEAMSDNNYDCGLGFTKKAIMDVILRQK